MTAIDEDGAQRVVAEPDAGTGPTVALDVDPFSEDVTERPGAVDLLRAGVAATPELRAGLGTAIGLSVANAAWRLVVPVALQQVLDRGLSGSGGVDIPFVLGACAAAAVVVLVLTVVVQRLTMAMARVAEDVLYALRTRAFAHVHRRFAVEMIF